MLLSSPYWILGSNSYVRIHDNADSLLPIKIAQGEVGAEAFTRLAPFAVSGFDLWATDLTFNVDTLFFMVLPGWAAYGLLMFLQRFIAGYFTYRLLKESLGTTASAAAWGGMLYALFNWPSVHSSWAGFTVYDGLMLPALPLLMWVHWRYEANPVWQRILVAAGSGVFLALTGPYAFAPFALVLLATWIAVRAWRAGRVLGVALAGVVVLAWAACESPSLLAAAALSDVSHRTNWDSMARAALQPAELLQYYLERRSVPALRHGWYLILFGFLGALVGGKGSRQAPVVLLAVTLLVSLLVGATPVALRMLTGGTVGFQVDRWYLLLPFLMVVTGAVGVSVLQSAPERDSWRAIPARIMEWLPALLIVVLLYGSVPTAQRIVKEWRAGHRYSLLHSETAHIRAAHEADGWWGPRVVTIPGSGNLHPAYAAAYGIPSADGYVTLYPGAYHAFWKRVIRETRSVDPERREYFDNWGNRVYLFTPSDEESDDIVSFDELYDVELLSLLGTRFVISAAPLESNVLREVDVGGMVRLYENPGADIPAFVAHGVRVAADRETLLDEMEVAPLSELRASVYLVEDAARQQSLQVGRGPARANGSARIESQNVSSVTYRVESTHAGFLCIMVPSDLGWRVLVDGEHAVELQTHGAFVAVQIPAGTSKVSVEPGSLGW